MFTVMLSSLYLSLKHRKVGYVRFLVLNAQSYKVETYRQL